MYVFVFILIDRAYCFTLPNYTNEEFEHIKTLKHNYMIIGKEKCPTTGTPHLQGYVQFKNARQFAAVKKDIPRAHIERAGGTAASNKKYCEKDGDAWESGEIPQPGKRNDIIDCLETAEKHGLKRACQEHPMAMIRYHKGITFVRANRKEPRDWEMIVITLIGISGSGKTTLAHELNNTSVYYKPDGEWWDNYDSEHTVILDDFYGGIKFSMLLKLLDSKPLLVPYKGGFHQFTSKVIIFTSNQPPEKWYTFDTYEQKLPSLTRRLNGGIWHINDAQSREQTLNGIRGRYGDRLKPVEAPLAEFAAALPLASDDSLPTPL